VQNYGKNPFGLGQGPRFLFGAFPVLDDLRNHPQFDPIAHYAGEMKRQYDLVDGEQFGEGLVEWEPIEGSDIWWLYLRIPIVKVDAT